MVHRVANLYRDAFSGLPRPIWWLALALLVNRAGTMVLPFLSLYFTRHLGYSLAQTGHLIALYGLGSVLGSWGGGRLSDRIGPIRVQRWSLLLTGLGFFALIPLHHPRQVAVAAFLIGLVGDAFRPALMVAATRMSDESNRVRAYALLRLAANAGMAIGPAVGGFLAVHAYRWLFIGDALTCWLAFLLLTIRLRDAEGESRAERAVSRRVAAESRSPWTDWPFVAFLVLVTLLALTFFQIFTTLPLHLRDHYGLDERAVGQVIALNALLIVLFEMVLLRRLEAVDPVRLAGLGGFLVGGGLALIPLGPPFGVALLAAVVWTVGEMLSLPTANAVVARRSEGGATGSYMGAFMVTFAVALILAPIVGTRLYALAEGRVLWTTAGAIGLVVFVGMQLLAPVLSRPRGENPPPSQDES